MASLPFAHSFKARLGTGRPQRLIWLSLGSPALAEIAAHSLPDGIVIDLQHGLWERHALEAAAGMGGARTCVIARTSDFSATAVGAALDAGVAALMAPLVQSADDARALVAAGRYPPRGRRSGGGVRPLLGGFEGMLAADREIALGAMIETAEGARQVETICEVEGLDFIFIGTGDLQISMAGASASEIADSCARIRDAAYARGLPCGLFTADAASARQAFADGYALAVVANDIGLATQGFADALRPGA